MLLGHGESLLRDSCSFPAAGNVHVSDKGHRGMGILKARIFALAEGVLLNRRSEQVIAWAIGRPGSLRFRLARDTLGVMILKALSMGLGFLISVVLARLLGVREFGLYAFAMSLLGLLSAPAAFGFPQLLVREIAASRARAEWGAVRALLRFSLSTVLGASLVLALLAGLGIWFFSDYLPSGAKMTLTFALLALPFMALIQLEVAALRGFDRILEGQMINGLLRPLTFLGLITGVWILGHHLLNATVAVGFQVVTVGVAVWTGWLLLRRAGVRSFEAPFMQSRSLWLRSALWLLLLTLLNLIPQHSGVLFLGIMQGAEAVALYKVAYQAASLIPFGLMAVNIVIAPTLSQLYASGELGKLQQVTTIATGVSLICALPLVLLFTIGGRWFLGTVFGPDYLLSAVPLAIMTIGQFINVATGPVGLILTMTGHEKGLTLCLVVAYSMNVVLNLSLIPFLSVIGASLAFAFSTIMVNFLGIVFMYKVLAITPIAVIKGA